MALLKQQLFVDTDALPWEIVGDGVRRKITSYSDELMTVLVEFKQGAVGYLHRHPHVQISYVQAGSFEVTIDGEMKILSRGDFFQAQSNLEHGVRALEDGVLLDVFSPMREDFITALI